MKIFLLLPSSVVEQLKSGSPGFRTFLDSHLAGSHRIRSFPNGAIEIEGDEIYIEMRDILRKDGLLKLGLEGLSGFRPLAPFSVEKKSYCIRYLDDYRSKLANDVGFLNGSGNTEAPKPGELQLSNLEVSVFFRRRLSSKIRLSLAAFVARWANRASARGAFHDGPVQLASSGITFFGPRAQFLIDVSRSGQDTLNWLSLELFEFGIDVHTVTQIGFGLSPETLDSLSPWAKPPDFMPFPKSPGSQSDEVRLEGASTRVPPAAAVDPEFHSDRFPIYRLPNLEWDSFTVTIFFLRTPSPAEREEFTSLIASWLLIGSYGGFGGAGIRNSREVEFNEDTDSATIYANMGDSEENISLSILIKIIINYQKFSNHIDFIVFGNNK